MRFVILFSLVTIVGCASWPTLEELEDEASESGDWAAVETREENLKKELEVRGPGCPPKLNKYCVEEQTGIQCYCVSETLIRE
jgi:hypothetical protein